MPLLRTIFVTTASTALILAAAGCDSAAKTVTPSSDASASTAHPTTLPTSNQRVVKSDAQWKQVLTPNQYYILREQGTEPPYQNAFWDNHTKGMYICAACGHPLFSSDTKFNSHTGWPSFWTPLQPDSAKLSTDADGQRTEVTCPVCGGHLGHVFDDGPQPTGKRYCMDSGALKFIPAK